MKISCFFLTGCLSLALSLVTARAQERPALTIVIVIDGLRPDSITPAITPNLDRLKTSGVWYTRSHSVFPTVTRANTATIATGTVPSRHGIVSNSLYLPSIAPTVLSNGDYRNLLSLGKLNGGRVVGPKSLGEYFQAAGIRYVAISSGSTGNALLLNPTAPYGQGSLINPGFENGARVAFPDPLNAELLKRFGPVKGDDEDLAMLWTERVLREYVLDTLHPQVIVDWMGRTDSAQHSFGTGSPQGVTALRLVDQQIGLLLERLRQANLEDKTDIVVTCDHGFDYEPAAADALAPLRESGLAPGDVVVDAEGGASLLYVKNHDPEKISRLVAKFQASQTTNAIFVASQRPANGSFHCATAAVKGFAAGAFALELVNQCLPSHGPDMIVTYRWDDAPNSFGIPGTQWIPGTSQQAAHNGHGGLNPYVTHSTLIAGGPDFAQRKTIDLPAGNQDIAPTLLAIQGLPVPASIDGRVLSEALKVPPKARRLKPSVRRIRVSAGSYCSELEMSYAGNHAYLNHARRCAAGPNLQ
jgi:predicted AlkP superfamily pyrophosphatase or phosphodiesterase